MESGREKELRRQACADSWGLGSGPSERHRTPPVLPVFLWGGFSSVDLCFKLKHFVWNSPLDGLRCPSIHIHTPQTEDFKKLLASAFKWKPLVTKTSSPWTSQLETSISPADASERVSSFHWLSTDPLEDGKNRFPVIYLGCFWQFAVYKSCKYSSSCTFPKKGLIMQI